MFLEYYFFYLPLYMIQYCAIWSSGPGVREGQHLAASLILIGGMSFLTFGVGGHTGPTLSCSEGLTGSIWAELIHTHHQWSIKLLYPLLSLLHIWVKWLHSLLWSCVWGTKGKTLNLNLCLACLIGGFSLNCKHSLCFSLSRHVYHVFTISLYAPTKLTTYVRTR